MTSVLNQKSSNLPALPTVSYSIAAILLFWSGWYLATPVIPKVISGYFLEVHAAFIVGAAVAVFRQRREYLAHVNAGAVSCFSVGYAAWGVSDGCWALNYFIENNGSKVALGIFVTSLCCVSFCAFSLGVLFAHRSPKDLFADKRVALVSSLVGSGAMATLLLLPYFSSAQHDLSSLFHLSEIAAIGSGCLLLVLSIAVLLSSRRLAWSIFGGGMMCLVLGDSSIRVGKLLSDTIDLDAFSVLCSFGLYVALLPLLSRRPKEPIDSPDFSSLFTLFKFGSIVILLACLMAFMLAQTHNVENIKMITLCCGFGSIAAVIFSWIVVARVKAISTSLANVIQGDLTNARALPGPRERLPLELREYYDYVLDSAVKEHKALERAKQLDEQHRVLRRVAHNILSPVAALQSQIGDLRALSEETRLIMKTAIHDISDMAHGLSIKGARERASREMEKVHLLSTVESCLAQKRLQHKSRSGVSIDCAATSSYSAFAYVQEMEFRSIISNLLNNAVEALPATGGEVMVEVTGGIEQVEIHVRDNGKGMDSQRVAQLGEEGRTFDKAGGSGIGVHHARSFAEAWGGHLAISSQLGRGTTVTVYLPNRGPAPWFADCLAISRGGTVVVLDDSPAIHQVWSHRLAHCAGAEQINVVRFFTMRSFHTWHSTLTPVQRATALYLLDLELDDSSHDGIDLAQSLTIASRSILVTSHHGSSDVRSRCSESGMRLLPKSMAGVIPLRVIADEERDEHRYDAVLIDDDAVFRRIWQQRAEKNNKSLRAFRSVTDFSAHERSISRDTPIYIDSDLGTSRSGEVEAKRIRENYGFKNIYLASAYPPEGAEKLPWLSGIADKLPPWPDAGDASQEE